LVIRLRVLARSLTILPAVLTQPSVIKRFRLTLPASATSLSATRPGSISPSVITTSTSAMAATRAKRGRFGSAREQCRLQLLLLESVGRPFQLVYQLS